MKAIVNVYSWLDRVDMTPSDDEADNLKMYVSTFLTQYSWPAQDAWSRRENVWSEVPKFHMLYHWMQQGAFMNPRYFWTYRSEDFVGKATTLAMACTKGTSTLKLSLKLAKRFQYAMHYLLSDAAL